MRKRLLAFLLSLCMIFSLLPVTAFAAGDGFHDGAELYHYRITGVSLAKMLASKGVDAGEVENIDNISVTFHNNYYLSGKTFGFYRPDPANSNDYRSSDAFTPLAHAARPSDIDYLTITLKDDKVITLDENELTWTHEKVGGVYRYDLALVNAANYSVVTFMYQNVANAHWSVYDTAVVSKGQSLGTQMPEPPTWIGNHFVEWELYAPGSGQTFNADSPVSGDTTVYARKVSSAGGAEYRVMNAGNALLTGIMEEYNSTQTDESNKVSSIDEITVDTIQVNGGDGEHTNPDYFTNGWNDNDTKAYYYIYNWDAAAVDDDQKNTRVPPDEVTGITITYSVDGIPGNQIWSIPRDKLTVLPKAGGVGVDVAVEISLRGEEDSNLAEYTIYYYLDDVIREDYTESGTGKVGKEVSATHTGDFDKYLPAEGQVTTLTLGEGSNVLNLYWYTDVVGGTDPETGDGKPDIWQFKVTYAISGGTWDGVDDSDKVVYVTKVDSKGKPAADGTATLGQTIPEGMAAKKGFVTDSGAWSPDANATTVITTPSTFTYVYTPTAESLQGRVWLKIYKDGDTSKPVQWVDLGLHQLGTPMSEVAANANLDQLYTAQDKAASGFEWDGKWYKDGNVERYELGEVDVVDTANWNNIECMVYDKYPVNYHIGDAVVESGTFTRKDFDKDLWSPKLEEGQTFNGWYETPSDLAAGKNPHEQFGWKLAKLELYGEIIDTVVAPDLPTKDQIEAAFDGPASIVKVECTTAGTNAVHRDMYFDELLENGYDIGQPVQNGDGVWISTITIKNSPYVAAYNKTYEGHTLKDAHPEKSFTLTLIDNVWTYTGDPGGPAVVFDTRCVKPEAPSTDDVIGLFRGEGAVEIDCITLHATRKYELLPGSVAVGTPTMTEKGVWTCPITITRDPYYVDAYNNEFPGHTGSHSGTRTYNGLYWDDASQKWTYDKDNLPIASFDVTCSGEAENLVTMKIRFVLRDGTFISGGDYFLPEGVQNLSILEPYVPEGYQMAESGDFMVTAGGSRDVSGVRRLHGHCRR